MRIPLIFITVLALSLSLGIVSQAEAETREDVVGYWIFDFEPGFNLVAFPVLPDTPTLQTVIGDRLGEVEITSWDSRLGRYRWAKYDTDLDEWSGDLYLLSRGAAYWVNLLNEDAQARLIVSGHPEVYTRFNWHKLGSGWKYYGPVYGKEQELSDLPPKIAGDLLVTWNKDMERFELAVGNSIKTWYSPDFNKLMPDRGYIAYIKGRQTRRIGPPTRLAADKAGVKDDLPGRDDNPEDNIHYAVPPRPLIVGNSENLAICYQDGAVCGGDMTVNVIREGLKLGIDGELEPYAEHIDRFEIPGGGVEPGKVMIALTIGDSEGYLNPGDRVYMLVRGPRGASTRSISFEIPDSERFITDISFPNPLVVKDYASIAPKQFAISKPFPNPFNDRFSIEFDLPVTELVEYSIFDLKGRRVFNSKRPMSAGQHRMTVSANYMSAGIYILELKAGSHRGIAKIAHIK